MLPIHQYIDHTVLKPTTTLADVERCCREAIEYRFAAVCIPPPYVKRARPLLQGTGVKLATVIGFPFGYNAIESKLAECILAIIDGADELDMVINLSALKNADWGFLAQEINHIFPIVKGKDKVIKVIVESGILTREELTRCCELYGAAGADYLKTSTGYAETGRHPGSRATDAQPATVFCTDQGFGRHSHLRIRRGIDRGRRNAFGL